MVTELIKDIQNSSFILFIMDESEYLHKLVDIVKSVEKTKTRICYVCLNTPYSSIVEKFKMVGIDTKNFFFVDGVSRAGRCSDNVCTFVAAPSNTTELEAAIKNAIEKKKCSTVVFDTISALLVYQDSFSILHMTNNLQKKNHSVKKIFLVVKERPDDTRFVKDIGMFADKIMDL